MKYLSFVLLILFVSCNSSQIDREIIKNDDLIEPFSRNDFLYPENPNYKYIQVAKYEIDLNNNRKLDTIILRVIQDWNDPGDFHQLEIILDNGSKIKETEFGGWVKFKNYLKNDSLYASNLIKSDFLFITDFDFDRKLIIAFGQTYASSPGLITIIDANGQTPQVIFNRNFMLLEFGKNSFSGFFVYNGGEKETIKLINNRFEIQ